MSDAPSLKREVAIKLLAFISQVDGPAGGLLLGRRCAYNQSEAMASDQSNGGNGSIKLLDYTHVQQLGLAEQHALQELEQLQLRGKAKHERSKAASKYRILEQPYVELSSGVKMPLVGLGTW